MPTSEPLDVAVIGAGAAGLMAAIAAGRAAPDQRIALLDSAEKLGAKILISGGGRCNVTHEVVEPGDFCGGSPNTIRKVLRALDVAETIAFFESLGVSFKREDTGKLFPTTNRARTVLEALITAAESAGVRLRHPFRVETIERTNDTFEIAGPQGNVRARRVILATGGQSVVQTGSDGHGYEMARRLGHSITQPLLPALVPLLLPDGHPLRTLRGVATPARLTVVEGNGRRRVSCEGALLCTHFGISGPVVLDVSRHLLMAQHDEPTSLLIASWLPESDAHALDQALQRLNSGLPREFLEGRLPARLVGVLFEEAGVDPTIKGAQLTKQARRSLVEVLCSYLLPVVGPRGWPYAEVTAGGIPLGEVDVRTMASRVCPGLYLCGEILDVDGRIGGFNFQWAWASGHLAGEGAVARPTANGQ